VKRLGMSLLAVIAIALLGAVAVAPAMGAPKEVAYRCDLDICLLDPDNPADVYNLTFNGATSYDQEPVWSPDGSKLAFVAQRNDVLPATPNVYVMDPNKTEQTINVATQVTHYANGNVPLGELAWSPDGSKIAFVRGVASPGSQLVFVAESDGSSAEPVQIASQGGHPTWSPSGTQLAYWFSNQVYVKNSDGSGTATPLSGAVGREPIWSPDGSRIAFGHPAHPAEFLDLNILPAAGGSPTIVTSETQFIFASWSPSGSQIAYRNTSALNEGAGYVRVVNADGGGDHGLPVVQGLNFNGPAPSWSPDGSRLVFHGFYFGEAGTGDDTNEVYIANTNGTGSVTSLTGDKASEPSWKPAAKAVPVAPLPPLPGRKIKPKLLWFTNRIPWRGGYIEPMKVFCPVKDCIAKAEATAKAKAAAQNGGRHRTSPFASAYAKSKGTIVVARGKVKVPAGKQRPLKMKVTKKGAALIRAAGEVKIKVTVKISIQGQKTITQSKTVRVYLAKHK
jgi:Tol biopolymer transport system component